MDAVGFGKGDIWLGLVFCAASARQDGIVTYCCSLFSLCSLCVFVPKATTYERA